MDIRVLLAVGATAVMMASIGFVMSMVILSLVTGDSLSFTGGHSEALAAVAAVARA
ncbi:hypothetical protein [Microbacterium aurantiacum]|uniref:Uncharacterized protein n=1 Tax=Microbacterium aurantiacum TaxID=162393 RepID=A0AAJ2HF67_9MICO|nr:MULTISPECIES: hypothetical protein [Microbacterium]MDS0245041.1 hypothetical protein [Microbacterium aurantiacum]